MPTLNEILDAMAAILATAEGESRAMSEEETAEFEALRAKADAYEAAVKAREELAARRARAKAAADARAAAAAIPAATPIPAAPRPTAAPYERPLAGPQPSTQFETLSEFMWASVVNRSDARLAPLWRDRYADPSAVDQRFDTGSSGGFLIPPQFRAEFFGYSRQPAIVRPRARVIPPGSPPDAEVTFPASSGLDGGIDAAWTAEGGTKTQTNATFREIKMQPHEVSARVIATDKALRNSAVLSAFIMSALAERLATKEDEAFLNGSGVGRPLGFINSNCGATYAESRATSSTITYDDLVQMKRRFYGAAGLWLANPAAEPILRSIQDNTGGSGVGSYIWQPSLALGSPAGLLGMPILFHPRMPAVASRGGICLVDLGQYLIKDGSGPFIDASPHVYFESNRTVVRAYFNVDGQPWLDAPITDEDNEQYSPFVVLEA